MANPDLYVPSDHVDWRAIGWVVVVAALGNGWAWAVVLALPSVWAGDRGLHVVLAPTTAAFVVGLCLLFVRRHRRVGVILVCGAVLGPFVLIATALMMAGDALA